jgi:hypothetical protein
MAIQNCMMFILLFPMMTFAQLPDSKEPDVVAEKNNKSDFRIIKIDTLVTHCVSGEYNTPGFKEWNSITIVADIILPDWPKNVDTANLKRKGLEIMNRNKIDFVCVFRDSFSSGLFSLRSSYAAQLIKERDGYLGQFWRK